MPGSLSPETLARYGTMSVPRYTSYPTAPNFRQATDDSDHRRFLQELPGEPVSIYLHIPFCQQMCWYCGCHTTVVRRTAPVARYVASLAGEIRRIGSLIGWRPIASHLHWGGGTPTLLSAEAITALDRRLRQVFAFAPEMEIGLEADPRTLDRGVAKAFVDSGVNRVSLGVQTFDPAVQEAIHRIQPYTQVESAVRLFRDLGVGGINFDLIYGLPLQTAESCRDTVRQALALRPDRLAVFGYAHVPSFKPHQRNIREDDLPAAAQRYEQAETIAEELNAAGYRQIGLDHFALPGDALDLAAREGRLHRNFQGYTTDGCRTLIGLGASAISRFIGGFAQNATRIPDYQRKLASGGLATGRVCPISDDDARRAAIIEQLMCNYRADIGAETSASIVELERDGLIRRTGSMIEVRDQARPLVRAVAAAFDCYLPQTATRHVPAV